MWTVTYSKQARKDSKKILSSGLSAKVDVLLEILKNDPYQNPPPFEKLVGDLGGACSRRINIQHRLVYQVVPAQGMVKIIRLWTHYE